MEGRKNPHTEESSLHQQEEDLAVSTSVDEEKETQGILVRVWKHLPQQAPVSRLPQVSFSVTSSSRQRQRHLQLLH